MPSTDTPSGTSHLASLHRVAKEELAASFAKWTGTAPSHAAFAPGRVNLIGEHTDYNGGFVLPMAIQLGIYAAGKLRTDNLVRVRSCQLGETITFNLDESIAPGLPPWSNYIRGVVAGMQEAGVRVGGFDLAVHATLPAGGGLSSSAALEVATATAMEELFGARLDPVRKALLCQKAEHTFAGTPCGIMDQFAVIFGRNGCLLLIDCQSQECTLVPAAGRDMAFLVINTMVKHALSDGAYRDRRHDCFTAAGQMWSEDLRGVSLAQLNDAKSSLTDKLFRRARHVLTENERTLTAVQALRSGDWKSLGSLMYQSHESLRNDFEVSCTELDFVVDTARDLGESRGVVGCRMTGGGFGGCCVTLVHHDSAADVSTTIAEAYQARFGIEPSIFTTAPSDGAAAIPM